MLTYLYDNLFLFDVIPLIETWNDYSPIPPLTGYVVEQIVRNVSRNNRNYGDILVLVKVSAIEGNLLWLAFLF